MAGLDWSGALSLTERRDIFRASPAEQPASVADPETLLHRHQHWASRPVHASAEAFERRLESDGMSLAEFEAVAGGVSLPEAAGRRWPWLGLLEEICREWTSLQREAEAAPVTGSVVVQALASVLDPFRVVLLHDLRADLEQLRAWDGGGVLSDGGLVATLMGGFIERARDYAYPPAALELHSIREQRGLAESELAEAAVVLRARMRGADGPEFLAEYPVMARMLAELTLQHRRNTVELARRVRDDAALLAERFVPQGSLGRLVEARVPSGDFHRGGRAVRVLRFSGGVRVLYKPRSLAIDVLVADFLRWLNGRGIEATQRPVLAVDRGSYGWTEFVEPAPCVSLADVERFFRRQGGLVAACHALAAKDLHNENVIAAGEYPVVVDLEAFFQPPLPRQHGQAPFYGGPLEALESRLLPQGMDVIGGRLSRLDRSGIAGAGGAMPVTVPRLSPPEEGLRLTKVPAQAGAADNLPTLAGEPVDPAEFTGAVEAGFREVAEAIRAGATELTGAGGLLERAGDIPIRVLFRPTLFYARLATSSSHPRVLRDALDRERAIDVLWPAEEAPPAYRALFTFERRDMLQGDVPVFTMAADGLEVMASEEDPTGVFAPRSGLSVSRERVERLDDAVIDDLAWAVRASLASRSRQGDSLRPRPLCSRVLDERPVPPDALRQRSFGLAGLIAQRCERGPDGTTWAGFTSVPGEGWVFGPLRTDLFHGTAGVVLFLAYAGACSREGSLVRHAREGLDAIRRTWERRLQDPAGPEMAGVNLGGACEELGGVVLALTHLSVLWGRDALAREALDLCRFAEESLDEVTASDVVGGLAGTLAVVLTLHRVLADDGLLRLATRCGELLATRAEPAGDGLAWPDGSGAYRGAFAHGAAGIAASLVRLARVTRDPRWADLAAAGRAFEASLYSEKYGNWLDAHLRRADGQGPDVNPVAWCAGAAGVALGRAIMFDERDEDVARDLRRGVGTMARTLVHRNHGLCHGSFGKLVVLRRCQQACGEIGEVAGTALRRLVPATLDTVDNHGFRYPVPDGAFTPGLMLGAAGVGHALLALADPALPSLLGLDDLPE